ncbi:hypothetical protein ACJIZ3_009350 [Penstemon smallii]|uniref:SWIM-type domain-containing protein n=1 Tax=Penstemon smallii TaxID=265156 RepID=A0ABD3TCB7_9LAMI
MINFSFSCSTLFYNIMEQTPNISCEDDDFQLCPDLNCGDEDEETSQSSLATNIEKEFASLTIEEMESRLEVGKPIPDEIIAYGMYCLYGRAKGFSVRKDNVEWFKDGSGIKARDFVCSCEGNKDEKRSRLNIPAFLKPTKRCNCKAKIRVGRLKGQDWRVTSFRKEHNHDMYSPDLTYLLRSSRQLSSEMQQCLESMVKCKIPVRKAYDFLRIESQGRENVGCTQKDMYDAVSRAKKQSIIERSDADQLVEYFMNMTNKEPGFYWNAQRDEDKRLVNFFFRDYRCRIDYEYFGDVLSVDTTYRTNKYNMICCPFVGINHHWQTVMFGCAFMSNEKESSFEWLFTTFLESMGGKQPETIFTDQCRAMMNAIDTVFPESHHRLCHWHINQNTSNHFGSLKGDEMVDDYNIEDKDWFTNMYNLRHRWATAFSCHRFSAGLNATSRSKGTNAALKNEFGGSTSSLYECVLSFDELLESWRNDEKIKDNYSHHYWLPVGLNPYLKQHDLLSNFAITEQVEVFGTSLVLYTMNSRMGRSRSITVQFDSQTSTVACSCHKYETCGILCSHAIKVLERVNIDYIPEIYIKKRWTKSVAKRICDGRGASCSGTSGAFPVVFVPEMVRKVYGLAGRAKFHNETRSILAESLESVESKLNDWFENFNLNVPLVGNDGNIPQTNETGKGENVPQTNEVVLLDPHPIRTRGYTDVHIRHWDAKGRKSKGRGQRLSKF